MIEPNFIQDYPPDIHAGSSTRSEYNYLYMKEEKDEQQMDSDYSSDDGTAYTDEFDIKSNIEID